MSSRSSRPSVHPVFFHASTLDGGPHGTVDICSSAEMTTGSGPLPKSVKVTNNFIALLFYAERDLVEAKTPNRNIQTESDPPLTLTDHPATSDVSQGGESHIPADTVDTADLASAVISKQPEVRSQSETGGS
ncbi:hypothetical protein ElyMa_004031800 [Elysia marginata]|uniref:Uncharacterized protein n=1 Tax=Elysia marginata TaxID=1093978 RepID=A0AAV4G3X8_9GAST|nr:hypothetical protein ElyMa_004031800 [Elysia marginata]